MSFRIHDLTTAVVPMACGWTVYPTYDPSSVCTGFTEDATGFRGDRRQSEERLALLQAELRKATAVH